LTSVSPRYGQGVLVHRAAPERVRIYQTPVKAVLVVTGISQTRICINGEVETALITRHIPAILKSGDCEFFSVIVHAEHTREAYVPELLIELLGQELLSRVP
jgi:hypothetical protein